MLSKKGNSDRYIRENGSTETYNIKCNNKEILPAQSEEWVKFFLLLFYFLPPNPQVSTILKSSL